MTSTTFLPRNLQPTTAFLFVCLFGFFLYQQIFVFGAWTSVPFVDSWPVFDRFMRLYQGQMNWSEYLLSPHGSHLHSIVYFIYALDIFYFSGRQFLPLFASFGATLIVDVLFLFAFFAAIKDRNSPRNLAILAAAVAIFFINAPSGANLHIFQVVLIVSRTTFAAILWGMIYAIQKKNWILHVVLIAFACLAVTFHGSGVLFALIVFVLHAVFGRGVKHRLLGVVPIIAVALFIKAWIPEGSGELAGILKVLQSLSMAKIENIMLGAIGYYATPLVCFWGYKGTPPNWGYVGTFSDFAFEGILPNRELLIIGGTIMLVTTLESFRVLWKALTHRHDDAPNAGSLLMALLSLFVLISAFSAALFWSARYEIAANTQKIYPIIIASTRYACFASLAYAHFLFIIITYGRQEAGNRIRYALVSVMLCVTLTFQTFLVLRQVRSFDIDISATQVLVDSNSVLSAIGSYSWTDVGADVYWSKEIPKTVQFMSDKSLSFFHGMPRMGESMEGAPKKPLNNVKLAKLPETPTYCRIEASAEGIKQNIFHQPRILPIMNTDGRVAGFSAIIPGLGDTSFLVGTVACTDPNKMTGLFVIL